MATKNTCPICGHKLNRTTHGGHNVEACPKCSYVINIDTGKVLHGHSAPIGQRVFLNCPNCNARLSAQENRGTVNLECPYCSHTFNHFTGDLIPGENQWAADCPQCGCSWLITANEGSRKITCPTCEKIWRFNSDTGEYLPDAAVMGDKILVTCPECGTKNRVPAGLGNLLITCGVCSHQVYLNGNPALKNRIVQTQAQKQTYTPTQPQPTYTPNPTYKADPPKTKPEPPKATYTQPPQPESPAAQPSQRQQRTPCRTITITRSTHAYKEWDLHGLENAFRDKWPVRIVLDEVEQGALAANETMVLNVDSGDHTIKYNLLAPRYYIPAGTDNYIVNYFRDEFKIGPENDEFRDRLTSFMVDMFRGQGIRDRILDDSNYGNKIYLDITSTGIRLYWTLDHQYTKGLKALLTGEGEEKISYDQIGITPPSEEVLPGGYWGFIQYWIENAILKDKQADMDKIGGGFTFRKKHDLF